MLLVFIDPRTRISYASYYIYGLYEVYGKRNVKFSMKYFTDLKQNSGLDDFDQYFAYVIIENGQNIKRAVIDYRDKSIVNKVALAWCDVYGKVNYNSKTEEFLRLSEEFKQKIIPIGPNFGIKIWSLPETISYLFINYLKCINYLPVNFRSFLSGYNWQIRRMPFDHYRLSQSKENYVFHVSSLYYNKENSQFNTNSHRASFIRACKKANNLHFEGGLFASANHPEKAAYDDVITNKYVKPNDYLNNLRKSSVVFNTPAIWGCHGWKLGEFLAMGKAIISTPLTNEMPFPLEHGTHVHFVNSDTEIERAVQKILSDKSYRQQLESGAKSYFNTYLSPAKVTERLIK